jgi:hypothetical protein
MATPTDLFYLRHPPTDAGLATAESTYSVQSQTTSGVAATFDWVAGLASINAACKPLGTVLVSLQSVTTDCVVRFKATGAAGTTLTNGARIPAGQSMVFHCDPVKHNLVDFIATGAGTLLIQVISEVIQRRTIA